MEKVESGSFAKLRYPIVDQVFCSPIYQSFPCVLCAPSHHEDERVFHGICSIKIRSGYRVFQVFQTMDTPYMYAGRGCGLWAVGHALMEIESTAACGLRAAGGVPLRKPDFLACHSGEEGPPCGRIPGGK